MFPVRMPKKATIPGETTIVEKPKQPQTLLAHNRLHGIGSPSANLISGLTKKILYKNA